MSKRYIENPEDVAHFWKKNDERNKEKEKKWIVKFKASTFFYAASRCGSYGTFDINRAYKYSSYEEAKRYGPDGIIMEINSSDYSSI